MKQYVTLALIITIVISLTVGILYGVEEETKNEDKISLLLDQIEGDSVLIEQLEDELQEEKIKNRDLSTALTQTLNEYIELKKQLDIVTDEN